MYLTASCRRQTAQRAAHVLAHSAPEAHCFIIAVCWAVEERSSLLVIGSIACQQPWRSQSMPSSGFLTSM